jgi:ribosomal protein S6
MKKNYTKSYPLLALCVIIFMFLNGCSKEDSGTKSETETVNLSTIKDTYASYEMVTFSVSDNLITEQSFDATINNTKIVVGSNENTASFVLPSLANGNYNLSFTLNNKNYNVPVKVQSISNMLSADQYFNDLESGITQNINALNSQIALLQQNSSDPNEYANLKKDVEKYTNLLNNYKASYANLSPVEKDEFAKTIAANKVSLDEYNSLSSNLKSGISTLKNAQSIQDYEKGVEVSKGAFAASVVFTVAHIPAMITTAKLIASPNPWISAGAILATGLIFTSYCINVDETITASHNLTSKAIKPFEFISDITTPVYKSGVEAVSSFQAKYRSLIGSDSSDSGSTISNIIENYNNLKDKYNGFVSALPSILKPSYIMTSLKSTYQSTTRSIYNQYISISNISNSNVKLQQINQPDGSINIKATNTSASDQTFTYDVNYTNNKFSNGLKKTVYAKVLATDPCDEGTTTAPVINSVDFDCNAQKEISILISFTANDSGILPYGDSGACEISSICYPVRLYFMNPGATDYSIAANGYSVKLKSGTVNSGVVEITITNCQNGKSPLESLQANYPNYKWKVELINQCNQRSNQISF